MEYNITYRKKDGGWQYIISFKENGKWRQRSKQGFRTRGLAKVAADKRLDKLKEDFESEKAVAEEYLGITFAEFKEIFIKNKEIHRENNTVTSYKNTLNHFESLDTMEMKEIRYVDIQNCIDDLVKKELNISTIKLYASHIKHFFSVAVDPYSIIASSPVSSGFILPKTKTREGTRIRALTKSRLDELLSKMYPEKDYVICLIAATVGLRIGEILGLCEPDIDLINFNVNVNKQWKKMRDGGYGFGPVKSKNSERVAPVSLNTIKILRQYIQNRKVKDFNRRIFAGEDTATASSRLGQKFKRLGFNNSIHDLRHTYATLLIGNGVDFETVAELLGDTVEMVMKTYSHYTADMTEKVTQKINQIF